MTTKAEIVAQLKAENPTLKVGDDVNGYTDLEPADYEAKISEWVEARLAAELEAAKVSTAAEKLYAATGLTVEEYKALGL